MMAHRFHRIRILSAPAVGAMLALGFSMSGSAATAPAQITAGWQVVAPRTAQLLFHDNSGIAVDAQHDVYVSDPAEGRVKKFSPSGKLLASWGSDSPSSPLHWYPTGVATNGHNAVYVLAGGVTEVTPSGRYVTHWNAAGATALAVGGSGNVFVLSTERLQGEPAMVGRVDKFSPSGRLLSTYRTLPSLADSLHDVQANGLAVDPHGNIYVSVATQDNTGRTGPFVTSVLYRFTSRYAPPITVKGSNKTPLGPIEAADAAGNMYLAPDLYSGNSGIEKLSPSGKLLGRWTAFGGGLSSVVHLALDKAGRMYIAETRDVTVAGNTTKGSFVHIATTSGRSIARWGRSVYMKEFPLGLSAAVGPDGTVYATVNGQNVFLTASPDGKAVRYFGKTSNTPPVVYYGPSAIAVGGQGNVFVTDSIAGAIDKFSPGGKLLDQWHVGPPGHNGTQGLALDANGNMYTIDFGQVLKLSPDGAVIARFGAAGSRPGQFSGARALAVDVQGNMYVADMYNNRIQKLSPTGQPLTSYGSGGILDRPGSVAVDRNRDVFAIDMTHPTVFEFGPEGNLLKTYGVPGVLTGQLNEPTAVASGPGGSIFVVDYGNNRIQKLVPNAW